VSRALPPGDCGYREVNLLRPFGFAGTLSGTCGLVFGVADSRCTEMRKAAGAEAGGYLTFQVSLVSFEGKDLAIAPSIAPRPHHVAGGVERLLAFAACRHDRRWCRQHRRQRGSYR
jgi:hypothetical protein